MLDIEARPGVKIVTDSSSAIPSEIALEMGIEVVSNWVNVKNTITGKLESFRDGNISMSEFLKYMQNPKNMPTTSAANREEFKAVYQKFPEPILSIDLGSAWSSVHENARAAAEEVNEEKGCEKVKVYDPGTISMGFGILAIKAAEFIASTKNVSREDVVKRLDNLKKRTTIIATLETLKYYEAGGRGKKILAKAGDLFGLQPIFEFRYNNTTMLKKTFSRKNSIEALINFVEKYSPLEQVGVVYGGNEGDKEDAEEVKDRIQKFCGKNAIVSGIGNAVLVHSGPGPIGVYLISEESIRYL